MPKLQVFLWKLCHASLLTRGNLPYIGMKIGQLCPHCNREIENAEHLFFGCHDAQQVCQLANDDHWVIARLPNTSQTKYKTGCLSLNSLSHKSR